MNKHGPKQVGRFIKKGDKLIESVSLRDFSFEDLSNTRKFFHDNANNNILHKRLHEPEMMEKVIRKHNTIDNDLRQPDAIRPILQPLDFTSDWYRLRERAARGGSMRMEDDEDEFEMELEFQAKKEAELKKRGDAAQSPNQKTSPNHPASRHAPDQKSPPPQPPASFHGPIAPLTSATAEPVAPVEVKENLTNFIRQKDNLDAVGRAINNVVDLGGETVGSSISVTKSEDSPRTAPVPAPEGVLPQMTADTNNQFIPVTTPEGDGVHSAEKEAIEKYKEQAAHQPLSVAQQNSQIEESKSQGYQEGFKIGEQKAALQFQQTANEVMSNLKNLVGEFEGLKNLVLSNVEDNFYEICQAMGESLLQHEFSINPETFVNVIRRAIKDTVGDNKFKIAINPAFHERVQSLKLDDLQNVFVKDDSVEPGNFRIDSQLSVVDGNIKKLIKDLLDQADTNIFKKTDKAS
jgi:flagellar biosynthesis/type III secretory pathway protein FliH